MTETLRDESPVRGLAHIAIATPDADALAATLARGFGGVRGEEEMVDGGTLRVVFVRLGPVTLELLEPRSPDHVVAKFLERRGPGLHHVSLDVANVAETLDRCRQSGIQPIDDTPHPGAHGTRVAFLHPRSVGGVLFELSQDADR